MRRSVRNSNALKGTPKKISFQEEPSSYIYTNDPKTLALLLKSPEVKGVVQSLDTLYDIVINEPKIGEELLENGMLDDILSLPENKYPYYNGVRYRFLCKLSNIFPNVKDVLKGNIQFIEMAMNDAMTTNDTPLKSYALQYVAMMTEDLPDLLCEFMVEHNMSLIFSSFLTDQDIDVQNNALALLRNLLMHPKTTRVIPKLESFKFDRLCEQVGCPYPDIQNKALDIIHILTSWDGDMRQWLQEEFSSAAGIDILLTVLYIFQWRDVHPKCLKILSNITESIQNLVSLDTVHGIQKLVGYINYIEFDDLQSSDMDILIKIARFTEGRLVMIESGAIKVFTDLLKKGSEETKIKANEGIRLLSREPSGLCELSKYNPVPMLIDIIYDEDNNKELRCSAGMTLKEVVKTVPVCAMSLSKKENFNRLVDLLKNPCSHKDCICDVLEALSTVLSFPTQLNPLVCPTLSSSLLDILNNHIKYREAAEYAAEILSWTLSKDKGRLHFISSGGVIDVMKILYSSSERSLLDSVGQLLAMAFRNPFLTDCFIRAGIATWFLLADSQKITTKLRAAAQTLFDTNLNLKFEYKGRLDIWDITTDGFYICRSPVLDDEIFPVLNDMIFEKVCSSRPVLCLSMKIESTEVPLKEDSISLFDIEEVYPPYREYQGSVTSGEYLREDSLNRKRLIEALSTQKIDLGVDQRLLDIYTTVQEKMETMPSRKLNGEEKFDMEWVQSTARTLGYEVSKALSGKNYGDPCNNHTLELHLQELKLQLRTSVILIGSLEVGGKLERAVLFKVLADRVGLPCALVRGEYGIGWVELVAVEVSPEVNYKQLPRRQLVTNYLVDLVNDPGALISLESEMAHIYCGVPKDIVAKKFQKNSKGESVKEMCRDSQGGSLSFSSG